jgi:hypothetical protein
MPNESLILAYQQSRKELAQAKEVLQKRCEDVKAATVPLAQAWLNEHYPDVPTKVVPIGENVEFSINYVVQFTTEGFATEADKAAQQKIFEELQQYLQSIHVISF